MHKNKISIRYHSKDNISKSNSIFKNYYFNERQYEYEKIINVFTYKDNYEVGGKCFFNALLQGFLSLSHFRNALFNKDIAYYLSQVKNNSVKVIDHMGVLLHLKQWPYKTGTNSIIPILYMRKLRHTGEILSQKLFG